ncbi:NDR1/HIN1-like protein 6 [Momordica charantia]|uniref:NDR1/HIN1-like protein 6 n=1 Tax=Momordica charantia TaxID=3673 RepID=A0A6J1D9D9_MOMCH|nr:NDR1/HIN1-like protein 6 [Momordica charantia]XP_022150414.1 NDR1/HIN1-like protein 6 [Momordica charantia]
MADSPLKPPVSLQKPPGYKDPSASSGPGKGGRKARLPTSYQPKKKRRNCCRTCCCVLCFLILFLIVVAALASALFYLLFDPKLPVFHLISFRISDFKVSPKADGSYLDAEASIRVEFKNPNDKLGIVYGRIEYDVTVGEMTEFGRRSIPGFTQGRRNSTTVKAETGVKSKLLAVDDGGKMSSWFQSKTLPVKVEADTAVGLVVQGWSIGPLAVRLDCESRLKSVEAGDMPDCNIHFLRWITIRG